MQYGNQVKIAEKLLSLLLTGRIVQIHILRCPICESLQSGFEAVFIVSSTRLIVAPDHPGEVRLCVVVEPPGSLHGPVSDAAPPVAAGGEAPVGIPQHCTCHLLLKGHIQSVVRRHPGLLN